MANVVEIVIRVDNAQAGAALASTQAALQQVGVAGNVSMTQLGQGASAAVPAMQNVGQAAQQMGGHITTSLDGVRLMSQEFGFRLPRALESMLSRMPAVTGAIQGMMGAFAGIAVAEVFVRMGVAAYNLYEKYISLTAAANDYNKEVQKHKDEAFVDTHSIEATTQRIDEATAAAKNFKAAGEEIHNGAWKDILGGLGSGNTGQLSVGMTALLQGRQLTDSGYKSQGQADALKVKQVEQEHEIARLKIEQQHAGDGSLQGQAKLNAELQKQIQLHQEDQNYTRQRDSALQPYGLKDGGAQKRDIENDTAMREIGAKRIEMQREIANKTIEMQNEATNAGLQGGALLLAQEQQAIATVQRSGVGTLAEIAAVKAKYAAESLKRIQDETDAVQKRADLERDASLTGLAKVQSEGQRKIDDVNDRQRKGLYSDQTAPGAPSKLAGQDRATAQAEQLRMMGDSEKQYREQQASEDQRAQGEQLTGFAKIDAEVTASTQKRADEFEKMYGQMAHDSSTYMEAQKQLEQSEGVIAQAGDRQRAQLEQEIRQQTLQQETEAAQAERRVKSTGIAGWVDDYHRGIAEVEAAEAASIAKINAEQGKSGVTATAFDLYQQQKISAEQKADAQIQQLNSEMAHQIAGVLQGAFDDPVHYIQNMMKKMMFNIMADWMAQSKLFSGTFGRNLGGGGGTAHGSGSGMLGAITGGASASNGTIAQASTAPGYSGTASGGGGGFGGAIASSGTITHMGMEAASNGAARQASVAHGYSGTAARGSGFGGSIGSAGTIAHMGMGTASANAASAATGSDGLPPIEAPMQMPSSGGGGGSVTGSGTVDHTMVAPGYSGTAATRSAGMGSAGMSGSLQTMGSIAQMGMSTAAALNAGKTPASAGTNAGTSAATDPWSDPKQMSSSDPTSPAFNPPSGSGLSSVAGGLLTAGVGAYTGTRGMIGAFEQGNATGILNGASSGMGMGASIGMLAGPAGAAIGAGIGAVGGALVGGIGLATGEGGNLAAANYFKTQMRPQMEAAASSYGSGGGGDALSGISQVNEIADSGFNAMMSKYGMSSANWVKAAYIDKERAYLETQINGMASGGRDYMSRSAAQFHTGGDITNFGGLSLGGNEGFIKALLGEKVTNQSASAIHGSAIDMMNDGASPSDMADHYLKSTGGAPSQSAQASSGDTHNWNVNAIDATSFEKFLTHGGGMTAVARATNRFQTQYAGDASHG